MIQCTVHQIARQRCEIGFDRSSITVDPLELELFVDPEMSDLISLSVPQIMYVSLKLGNKDSYWKPFNKIKNKKC